MCKSLCIGCNETISVPVSAGKVVAFPSSIEIAGKTLKGIALRKQNAGGTAKNKDGKGLANDAVLDTSFLTLKSEGGKATVQSIPLTYIAYSDSMFTCIQVPNFSPNNSEILFSDSTLSAENTKVVEITFFYDCPNAC